MRYRRKDVEEALARVSRAAVALGMRNRFEVQFGNASVQHVLLDHDPAFAHAHQNPIGTHLRDATLRLEGMAYGLESAVREMARQEDVDRAVAAARRARIIQRGSMTLAEALKDPNYPIRGSFADPDARSVRRAVQERIPDRPDGWHRERPV